MATYGSEAGVEALVGDVVASRNFTTGTFPTIAQVTALVDQVDAMLNDTLASAGYTSPVVTGDDPNAFNWCVLANNAGASALVLQMFPGEAFDPDNPDAVTTRANELWKQLTRLLKRIDEKKLQAARTTRTLSRIFSGGQENSDGQTKLPIFSRDLTDYPASRSLTTT